MKAWYILASNSVIVMARSSCITHKICTFVVPYIILVCVSHHHHRHIDVMAISKELNLGAIMVGVVGMFQNMSEVAFVIRIKHGKKLVF